MASLIPSIRRDANRTLTPEEAISEGVKNLRKETTSALAFAASAERLPSFPSKEEKKTASENIGLTISSLKEALKAAESMERNIKKM